MVRALSISMSSFFFLRRNCLKGEINLPKMTQKISSDWASDSLISLEVLLISVFYLTVSKESQFFTLAARKLEAGREKYQYQLVLCDQQLSLWKMVLETPLSKEHCGYSRRKNSNHRIKPPVIQLRASRKRTSDHNPHLGNERTWTPWDLPSKVWL